MSTAFFEYPFSLGTISSTPIITGGPTLVGVTDDGVSQIIEMTYNSYVVNDCGVSFLLADGTSYQSIIEPLGITLDTANIAPVIVPDCGQNTSAGQVQFSVLEGVNVNLIWSPSLGIGVADESNLTQLPAGAYVIVIQDENCLGIFSGEIYSVPVSPITFTIDQVTPVSVCTSQTVQASGTNEGAMLGTISGGSGAFTVLFSDQSGYQLPTEDLFYGGIDNEGVYSFDIQDDVTNCIVSGNYTIPQVDVQVDILVSETQQLITNGNIILQTAMLEADLIFSNGMEPAEFYEWSPIGFLDDGEGMYSEIDTEGTYTVNVDVFGGSCSASTTFEVVSTLCILEGDINLDGIVNGADLVALLGSFGTICNSSDPCPGDINHDGVVNQQDMLAFYGTFGLSWESVCGSN